MSRPLHRIVICIFCLGMVLGHAIGASAAEETDTKTLVNFQRANPFQEGKLTTVPGTDTRALRINNDYAGWAQEQDWRGFDYLNLDVFTESKAPMPVTIEIHDRQTTGYWTRVNYQTLIPPGRSTIVLPLGQLYVGEKSRPGRLLMLEGITKFVIVIGQKPAAPLYVESIRLQKDTEFKSAFFPELKAFDLGPISSPTMPGFTLIDPDTRYDKGKGYGLLPDTQIWRAVNALQPDPLFQDFLCITRGGVAVDVPNGRYHVWVNIDSPNGFWGEVQTYTRRQILAQDRVVIDESMNFDQFREKYFQFWNTEDLPTDNTFDKYDKAHFSPKEFDVDVTDGQLRIGFRGENWACCVSGIVIYPAEKADQGKKFLAALNEKRRFFFDNSFHRILHAATGDPLAPTPDQKTRGYIPFVRDIMQDVYYNDTPVQAEIDQPIRGFGFAGEYQPLSMAILPLLDLGKVTVTVSDLTGPAGTLPGSDDISVAYASYRIRRVSSDGAIYTFAPRLLVPSPSVDCPANLARRWWIDVHPSGDAKPGLYKGTLTMTPAHGQPTTLPIEYRVYPGTLDSADIPIGPWGHEIPMPWHYPDPAALRWRSLVEKRALLKLRDSGFTTFTGLPYITYQGFKDGKPQFDFSEGDRQMALAQTCGFTMPVISYCPMVGLDLYYRDVAAMKAAKYENYSMFVKALFGAIQAHAADARWLPVYWNIGDEPVGDDLKRATENAEAYHAIFAHGPCYFTAATSVTSDKPDDQAMRFALALNVANLNQFTEATVRAIAKAGGEWAFYNDGNRWTFGTFAYKAAKQFGMKFRLGWHFNASAGDPFYALDCREDDYAWLTATPDGQLMASVEFQREMREGLNDYRLLLTLDRMVHQSHDAEALKLLNDRLNSFTLEQRDHNAILPPADWTDFRKKVADEIARLRS